MSSFTLRSCFKRGGPFGDIFERCTCVRCRRNYMDEVCFVCCFGDGDSFAYDLNPNSFNDLPNDFTHPPQPQYESYSCELCGNDSHYGYDCPPRFPLVLQQKQATSIDKSPIQEMSIQDMEDLKRHYLDEMLSLSNDLQIKDYHNEKIDIRFRRECESMIDELKGKFNGMSIEINKKKELQHLEQVANLSTYPSQCFKSFCYDDDDDYDYKESIIPLNEIISQIPPSIAITLVLSTLEPEDSLITGNEDLSTILEKESEEVIKSSVEDLVRIPRKFVTFFNPLFYSNDDFTSSDDESLSDEDVPKEKVKIYSNPLFEFDDEYISSDVNPLFDEVLEDIESKDSYVSNLNEPALLVTPLSAFNKDECFDPGGDVDEIEFLLHCDPSTPKLSVASILEGFTDKLPLEENGDLFDLESKDNEWKKILYDAQIDGLMIEDKVFDLGIHKKKFSPTYVSLPFEGRHYLSLTYVIRNFLPYFTYPVDSSLPLSSGSEDIIFVPDISAFHFSSLEPVAYKCPIEVCSSTCFVPNIR
ncbi:hypothetical protein Tco_1023518 [Tanacetum coccineum]